MALPNFGFNFLLRCSSTIARSWLENLGEKKLAWACTSSGFSRYCSKEPV
jgi:hypothetical protein